MIYKYLLVALSFIIPLRLLDIGCGWGTLVAYAAKNFGCDATGVTLARNQTQFGTERIAKNGARVFPPSYIRALIMFLYIDSIRQGPYFMLRLSRNSYWYQIQQNCQSRDG